MHQDEPITRWELLAIHWYAVRVDIDCAVPSPDGFNVLQLVELRRVIGARLLYPILQSLRTVVDRKARAKCAPLPLLLFIVC